jgi:hypothetical protein
MRSTELSIKEKSVCHRQHVPPLTLGEQQQPRAEHITMIGMRFKINYRWAQARKDPQVTVRECLDTISLRMLRYSMMGLPSWSYVSTLGGTNAPLSPVRTI